MTSLINKLRDWARLIKRDVLALWIAARDQRTPVMAKIIAAAVAAYALSPIDLIPDFIPILGLLDDAILLPLGILLAVQLIPPDLMAQYRESATELSQRPTSRAGLAIVAAIWLAAVIATASWLYARSQTH